MGDWLTMPKKRSANAERDNYDNFASSPTVQLCAASAWTADIALLTRWSIAPDSHPRPTSPVDAQVRSNCMKLTSSKREIMATAPARAARASSKMKWQLSSNQYRLFS
jgi:hypothetical protein